MMIIDVHTHYQPQGGADVWRQFLDQTRRWSVGLTLMFSPRSLDPATLIEKTSSRAPRWRMPASRRRHQNETGYYQTTATPPLETIQTLKPAGNNDPLPGRTEVTEPL